MARQRHRDRAAVAAIKSAWRRKWHRRSGGGIEENENQAAKMKNDGRWASSRHRVAQRKRFHASARRNACAQSSGKAAGASSCSAITICRVVAPHARIAGALVCNIRSVTCAAARGANVCVLRLNQYGENIRNAGRQACGLSMAEMIVWAIGHMAA